MIGIRVYYLKSFTWNNDYTMKILKLISNDGAFYPATVAPAIKDLNFLKDDDSPMTQEEINLYLNSQVEVVNDNITKEINKLELNKYVTQDEFTNSVDTSNLVTKGSVATINGQTLIKGGNIEIDSSIYKVVTTLPTTNINIDKIYLTKAPTSTSTQTNFECWQYENNEWVDLGPFGSVKIDLSAYLSKEEADQRYAVKSSNANSALIIKDNGQIDNLGNNGQAFNAVRDVSLQNPPTYNTSIGSGYPINCASFGVKSDGTTGFSHKKYDSFTVNKTNNTTTAKGAKNTAVLVFSGKSGLMYAKNTGTGNDVTEAMYKYVGVIDSPDEKQRCYSAAQVDGITDALTQRISDLEGQNEYLMGVINLLIEKTGITSEELVALGSAQQSLSNIDEDVEQEINKNTLDYSDRSNESQGNNDV